MEDSKTAQLRASLGFMLREEWDRRLALYGLENACGWMRKLDDHQFERLIEAMRFGRRAH